MLALFLVHERVRTLCDLTEKIGDKIIREKYVTRGNASLVNISLEHFFIGISFIKNVAVGSKFKQ